jgi:hypothetical protein
MQRDPFTSRAGTAQRTSRGIECASSDNEDVYSIEMLKHCDSRNKSTAHANNTT